jgi:hypothetical protein
MKPNCNWKSYLITLTPDKQTALDPDNQDILVCKQDITFVVTNTPSRCFYVRVMGEEKERDAKYCDRDGALLPLKDVVSMRSADGTSPSQGDLRASSAIIGVANWRFLRLHPMGNYARRRLGLIRFCGTPSHKGPQRRLSLWPSALHALYDFECLL